MDERKIRVVTSKFASDVAKEFGITFTQLRAECQLRGHSVSSASSILPVQLVDWLRRELAPGDAQQDRRVKDAPAEQVEGPGDWERALAQARRRSRQAVRDRGPKYSRRHPAPALIRTALDYAVVPLRSRGTQRPIDVWTHEEIHRAERIALSWASVWFSASAPADSDPVPWLRVAEGERPDLAARLATAGLSPAEAELRLDQAGGVDPAARSVMTQVIGGLPVHIAASRVVRHRARSELA